MQPKPRAKFNFSKMLAGYENLSRTGKAKIERVSKQEMKVPVTDWMKNMEITESKYSLTLETYGSFSIPTGIGEIGAPSPRLTKH